MSQSTQKLTYPIGVSIISGNEAHRIGGCLESVSDWVSAIVVVLNEDSDDETEQIAKSYGAQVYRHPWHGHRDQKNIALSYITQPWILALDCDEVVSSDLKDQIQAFVSSDNNPYNGAYFPRVVWFMERWICHGDWYPDYSLRLFRKESGKWSGVMEHDTIELEGKSKKLNGWLHHYSFPNLDIQVEKMVFFGKLFCDREQHNDKRYSYLHIVARAWWRFFRAYILKRGFLDGFAGYYIAKANAFFVLYKYARLKGEKSNSLK